MLLPAFPPDYSGAGKQALRLAQELILKGIAISVITYRHSKRAIFDNVQNIKVIRLPVFGPEVLRTILFNLLLLYNSQDIFLIDIQEYCYFHLSRILSTIQNFAILD